MDALRRVEIVPLQDEAFGVVADKGLILHLSATARVMIDLAQAGLTQEEIVAAFANATGAEASQVAADLAALNRCIRRELDAADRITAPTSPSHIEKTTSDAPPETATYRLFERDFRIIYPEWEVARWCHTLLAPMQVVDSDQDALTVRFDVSDRDGYTVSCGAATVHMHRTPQAAFTGLQNVILGHDRTSFAPPTVVLHTAGVVGAKGVWLIGGVSGRGKSTLTAFLDAAGYRVFGDDILPVDLARRIALPLPMAMSVKEGAFDAVARVRPEIAEQQTRLTNIGKRARFLAPLHPPLDTDRAGLRIAGLLLPNRQPTVASEIRPIDLKPAMLELCDRFGRFPLDASGLQALIDVMDAVPRYELIYEDAQDILGPLGDLL